MNRLMMLAMGMILLLFSHDILGQHGGHSDGRRGVLALPVVEPTTPAYRTLITRFEFKPLPTRHPKDPRLRRLAQDLLQLMAKGINSADLSPKTAALKDAVEGAQDGNQAFVKSLSKSQSLG